MHALCDKIPPDKDYYVLMNNSECAAKFLTMMVVFCLNQSEQVTKDTDIGFRSNDKHFLIVPSTQRCTNTIDS